MAKNIGYSLILPCYNEAEHFEESFTRIVAVLVKTKKPWEIILIDDKSTDTTPSLLRRLEQKKSPFPLLFIYHRKNIGRGATVAEGIRRSKGMVVGFMDIDCEIDPAYIPRFIARAEKGVDVVYATRTYHALSGVIRYLASTTYVRLVDIFLGEQFSDTEAGYKFFRRKAIMPILKSTRDTHWFWDTEIMVRARRAGLVLAEVPVVFNRRHDKTSTVRLVPDTLDYLVKLWRFRSDLESVNMGEKEKNHLSIQTYWQKHSPAFSNQYKMIAGIPLSPVGFFLQARHQAIGAMLSSLSGKKVLDVGCGSGVYMKAVIENGGMALGVDYSKQMLQMAKKQLSYYPSSRYKLMHADATNIPLPQGAVDVVLASGLTDYLTHTQVEAFMKEVGRVLRKRGHALITFPKKDSPLSLLRSGIGLALRKRFLKLPPLATVYGKDEIEKLFHLGKMSPQTWNDIFRTMVIVVAQKR